jgi:hypothetical protein
MRVVTPVRCMAHLAQVKTAPMSVGLGQPSSARATEGQRVEQEGHRMCVIRRYASDLGTAKDNGHVSWPVQ